MSCIMLLQMQYGGTKSNKKMLLLTVHHTKETWYFRLLLCVMDRAWEKEAQEQATMKNMLDGATITLANENN